MLLYLMIKSPEHLQIIPGRKQPAHLVQSRKEPPCIHKNRTEHKASDNQEGYDAAENLGPAAHQAQNPGRPYDKDVITPPALKARSPDMLTMMAGAAMEATRQGILYPYERGRNNPLSSSPHMTTAPYSPVMNT